VEDFCSAVDRCLHIDFAAISGQVINIGTGKSISILDIAKLILKMTKKDHGSLDYIPNRKDQLSHHTANIEKAQRLLGWKPAITIEQGIEKAITWYTDNQKWCEKQLWMRRIPILLREGERTVH